MSVEVIAAKPNTPSRANTGTISPRAPPLSTTSVRRKPDSQIKLNTPKVREIAGAAAPPLGGETSPRDISLEQPDTIEKAIELIKQRDSLLLSFRNQNLFLKEAAKQKVDELEKELQDLRREKDEAKGEMERVLREERENHARVVEEVNDLKQKLDEATAKLRKEEAKEKDAEREKQEVEKALQLEREHHLRVVDEKNTHLKYYEDELTALRDSKEKLGVELVEMKNQALKAEKDEELHRLKEDNLRLLKEHEEIAKVRDVLSGEKESLIEKAEEVRVNHETVVGEIQRLLVGKESEVNQLRVDLENERRRIGVLEKESKEKARVLQGSLDVIESEKREYEKLMVMKDKIHKEKVEELTRALEGGLRERTTLEEEKEGLRKEKEDLKVQLVDLEGRWKTTKSALEKAKEEVASGKVQLDKVKEDLTSISLKLEDLQKDFFVKHKKPVIAGLAICSAAVGGAIATHVWQKVKSTK